MDFVIQNLTFRVSPFPSVSEIDPELCHLQILFYIRLPNTRPHIHEYYLKGQESYRIIRPQVSEMRFQEVHWLFKCSSLILDSLQMKGYCKGHAQSYKNDPSSKIYPKF